jgi:hypothetical protein
MSAKISGSPRQSQLDQGRVGGKKKGKKEKKREKHARKSSDESPKRAHVTDSCSCDLFLFKTEQKLTVPSNPS